MSGNSKRNIAFLPLCCTVLLRCVLMVLDSVLNYMTLYCFYCLRSRSLLVITMFFYLPFTGLVGVGWGRWACKKVSFIVVGSFHAIFTLLN